MRYYFVSYSYNAAGGGIGFGRALMAIDAEKAKGKVLDIMERYLAKADGLTKVIVIGLTPLSKEEYERLKD